MPRSGHTVERALVRMALEVTRDVGVGEPVHPRGEGVDVALRGHAPAPGADDEQDRHRGGAPHPLRYNRAGSSTSRSSRSSVAAGGTMRASRGRHASGHPTPACTSDASTPG